MESKNILVCYTGKEEDYSNKNYESLIMMRIYDLQFNVIKEIENICSSKNEGIQGACFVDGFIYGVSVNKVVKFDLDLNVIKETEILGDWGHDIHYNNNLLYCVFSRSSRIVVLDLNLNKVGEYYHKDPRGDVNSHINSIVLDEYDNYYITAHNYNDEGYVYKKSKYNKFPVVRNLSQPHDYRIVKDGYVVCNSKKSSFIYSGVCIEKSWEVALDGFTRGVGVVDDGYYVGVSKRREYNRIYKINLNGDIVENRLFENKSTNAEIYSILPLYESKYNSKFTV